MLRMQTKAGAVPAGKGSRGKLRAGSGRVDDAGRTGLQPPMKAGLESVDSVDDVDDDIVENETKNGAMLIGYARDTRPGATSERGIERSWPKQQSQPFEAVSVGGGQSESISVGYCYDYAGELEGSKGSQSGSLCCCRCSLGRASSAAMKWSLFKQSPAQQWLWRR